jgi:hypothetical protein
MSDNSNQHLTVLVRPRQTRVAYLIDPASTTLELLDTIFSASTGFWGGRLFPIIPVIDGVISSGYWSLLRRIDPDWIYSYAVLPQDTVDQLLKEINPLGMEHHAHHLLQGDHPHYFPSLDHRLVRVQHLLGYATEPRWFRKPSLVTYRTKQGKTDPLIARNFGILRSGVLGTPIPEGISQFCFDETENFASLLEKLCEPRDGLIYPFAASSARAVVDTGIDTHWATYTLFVGEDLEAWIAFWNHIFTLGAGSRDTWKMFCLPAAVLGDGTTIEALTKFLRRYAYRNGNHPPQIHWTSASLTEDELKTLTAPFLGKKLDAFFKYSQRVPWSFPDMPPRQKYRFGFRASGLGAPELFGAAAHQIPNSGGLVNTPGVPFTTGPDEHWMQDVRIQYLADYAYYFNEELQYRLPQRGGIAPLFSALPGRVDSDGGLSYLTGKGDPLFVKIPEDRELILAAIGCGRRGGYDGSLQRQDLPPVYRDHGPSDKARYCRGVLDLFGGIQSAHHTFEIRFWKDTFYYLAGLGGREANTATGIVYQSIAKHPERWTLDRDLPTDEEIKRIEREVTKLAQYVRVRENEVTFRFLEQHLAKERAEFRRTHKQGEPEKAATPAADLAEIRSDLRRALQGFVDAKILRQGTNTRCRHCGSKIWQEMSFLEQEFKCLGCGALVHGAVEAIWYYRLNTLLRSGIVEHGTVALIAALAAAREQAKDSFVYSPGLVFYERHEDQNPFVEIDAICLIDGELWIGEVKTNASEFKPKEMGKLLREGGKMHADKAFVFALEGDQDALNRRCEEASKQNGITVVHLWPSSWGSNASFHI